MFEIFGNPSTSYAVGIYTMLLLAAPLLGYLAQKCKGKIPFWVLFCTSYLLLWYWYALSRAGADYDPYIRIFSTYDTFEKCRHSEVEFGYLILNYLVHFITDDSVYGVAIIKTLQLSVFYVLIYKLRERFSIPMLITVYVAYMYLQSFNVIRMSTAWSIAAFSYLYINEKPKRSLVLASVAFLFHRSSLFYLLFVLYYILTKNGLKRFSSKVIIGGSFAISIALISLTVSYGKQMILAGFADGRYDHYLQDISNSSIGLGSIILFVPQFILLASTKKGMQDDQTQRDLWTLTLIGTIIGTAVYLLGYQLFILSRASCYFICPMMFYMAFVCKNNKIPQWAIVTLYGYWYFRYLLDLNVLIDDSGIEQILFI